MNALWLLSDGATGNIKQAIALADALGLSYQRIDLSWQAWDRWLAPRFKRARFVEFEPIDQTWPDVAIGCGRMGAAALLALKHQSATTKIVQILHPRVAASRFDAVICPQHDQLHGDNVIQTIGSLHTINAATLSAVANQTEIASASPRRLLLIGAPNTNAPYTLSAFKTLCDHLQSQPGRLSISVSRRTPEAFKQQLGRSGLPFFDPATSATSNPYLPWLASAQQITVTPDSINMISEAIATTAAVYVPWREQVRGKFRSFYQQLDARLSLAPQDIDAKAAIHDIDAVVRRLRSLLSI